MYNDKSMFGKFWHEVQYYTSKTQIAKTLWFLYIVTLTGMCIFLYTQLVERDTTLDDYSLVKNACGDKTITVNGEHPYYGLYTKLVFYCL